MDHSAFRCHLIFILFYENSWSSQLRMRIPYMWRHKVTNKSISFYFFNFSFSRFVTLVSKDIIYLSIMSDNWYLSSLSNYNADVTPWRPAFESQIIIVWLSTDFFLLEYDESDKIPGGMNTQLTANNIKYYVKDKGPLFYKVIWDDSSHRSTY